MYDFGNVYEAFSTEEAIALKIAHPKAKIMAGGSDLLIQMRDGWFAGCDIISIYMIDALRGVTMDEEGTMRIGALTSFSHVTKSAVIQQYIPVLGEAVDKVGGPQIRNIGTIGGNVCNAHTGADSGATLFAYDALAEIEGPDSVRLQPVSNFYKMDGTGVTLGPGELLTALLIPASSYEGYSGSHWKYAMRNAMDVDVMGCSVNVKLSEDKKTIIDMRMAFAVMGPRPVRAIHAEAMAKGMPADKETAALLADAAMEGLSPRTDRRGTRELRLHTAHTAARRTLIDAMLKAGAAIGSETPDWAKELVSSEMGQGAGYYGQHADKCPCEADVHGVSEENADAAKIAGRSAGVLGDSGRGGNPGGSRSGRGGNPGGSRKGDDPEGSRKGGDGYADKTDPVQN